MEKGKKKNEGTKGHRESDTTEQLSRDCYYELGEKDEGWNKGSFSLNCIND